MLIHCPSCNTEYDCAPGQYECECGAKFSVSTDGSLSETDSNKQPAEFDIEKTIPPRREREQATSDVTMPGKRDRAPDGRFEIGDLILGRYKVLLELGQGGMGVVYKCFDEIAGIELALKALPPDLSHNTLEMEDIKENFQLIHNLHHPNIASYNTLERDQANGNYYLIMECVDGEDLRRWIRQKHKEGNKTVETVLPVIKQVAEALDYAHEQKIIHRDIKPGNIMIDAAGHVKVLDFGLAAQIHTSMTRVSMAYHGTSGTAPYMAPEQWRGRAQGAAADQYALAVMTYEMLAGHLPFESTDAAVLQQAVLTQAAQPLTDYPVYVQQALTRGMAKEPEERFPSCSDFVKALNDAQQTCRTAKVMKRGNNLKRNKSIWLILAGIIALLLIGIFFFGVREPSVHNNSNAGETLLGGSIIDNAEVFTSSGKKNLSDAIKRFEAHTGGKIVIYTVSTIGEMPIEDFSQAVAETQINTKYGVLLVLAINDHKSRLEIGLGWENKISNDDASGLLDRIVPELRAEKYADAAIVVVQGIEALITGEGPLDNQKHN